MTINKVGLIGLGIMGRPMATNLHKAGFALGVYARNPRSLKSVMAENMEIFSSPAELAKHCDVTITCVSDTPDVSKILTGEDGVINGAKDKHVVVDMSTISPEITRNLAKALADKNIDMLDAPVSGGEIGAIAGTLSIMVGGKAEIFDLILPIFKVLGKNIIHVGDHGAGQVAKACNQILAAQTISAVAEALLLAKSSDVDPGKVREALLGGFAYSKVLELHGQRMLEHNYKPGFKASLHLKDMGIALNTAKHNNISLPGALMAENYLEKVVAHGDGNLDSSAIAEIIFNQTI